MPRAGGQSTTVTEAMILSTWASAGPAPPLCCTNATLVTGSHHIRGEKFCAAAAQVTRQVLYAAVLFAIFTNEVVTNALSMTGALWPGTQVGAPGPIHQP